MNDTAPRGIGKFGCFQHRPRTSAVVALKRIKKINRNNETNNKGLKKQQFISKPKKDSVDVSESSDADFESSTTRAGRLGKNTTATSSSSSKSAKSSKLKVQKRTKITISTADGDEMQSSRDDNGNATSSTSNPAETSTTTAASSTTQQVSMDQTTVIADPMKKTPNYQSMAEKFIKDPTFKDFLDQLTNSMQQNTVNNNDNKNSNNEDDDDVGSDNSNGSTGTTEQNYFVAANNDVFYQFYRRDELPQGWTKHHECNDNTGYPASTTTNDQEGTPNDYNDDDTFVEEEDKETNFDLQFRRRDSRGRFTPPPRGRQQGNNWNRRVDRPPLLPTPTMPPIVPVGGFSSRNNRWSPNGADYQRNYHRPSYQPQPVANKHSNPREVPAAAAAERFKPQNSIQQNMAFSFALLHHAKVMSDMKKNAAAATTASQNVNDSQQRW